MASEDSSINVIKEELYASNMESKILTILSDAYPNLDCGPGTPIYEMVVRPTAMLWERQVEGINGLIEAIDATDYVNMPAVDLDILLARYFVTRHTGTYVTGVIRVYFSKATNVSIPAGEVWSTADGRTYEVISDHVVSYSELNGDEDAGYYLDIAVRSTGTSSVYNASANESVTVGTSCSDIADKAIFLVDTSDGGESESNYVFFNRAKEELAARNLYSYKSTRSIILDNFSNIKEVVPIGIRDDEMVRDLRFIPDYGTVHLGGKCDIYVRPYVFETSSGYTKPLCFPLTYKGYTLADNPDNLIVAWNKDTYLPDDKTLRGTSQESIPKLESFTGSITSLSYNLDNLDSFVASDSHELLHTDNVVKLTWPILVRVDMQVSSVSSSSISTIKRVISSYINSLEGSDYPRVADMIHLVAASCSVAIHVPVDMKAYYLTDTLNMESFGLEGYRYPNNTLLVPQEDDSLKFVINDRSQISLRTCCWYTNYDLINIEVV